jgi:hypothetical protein
MKKLIVVLLVVVIFVITNPNPQRHQSAIHAAIQEKTVLLAHWSA